MSHVNIISAHQSILALESKEIDKSKIHRFLNLKVHEAETLKYFCEELISRCNNQPFLILDAYYISYSIKQIGKEFDLLRFGKNTVVNIELKSELDLSHTDKIDKIHSQMRKNHYYLKALNRKIEIYTYIKNDGLYIFDHINDETRKVDFDELVSILSNQSVDFDFCPDDTFVPSKYLISPFNNTARFMEENYFLNDAQQRIEKDILFDIRNKTGTYYCISANAGTGKTLLIYDIFKRIMKDSIKAVLIHCGKLNTGHNTLISKYNWKIIEIASIKFGTIEDIILEETQVIIIDESQRISEWQLETIIEKAEKLKCMIIFSYDTKQYLRVGEDRDIHRYLEENHQNITLKQRTLTNKIRTNKEISSFITNLREIGKSNSDLNYKSITISYFQNYEDAFDYMKFLRDKQGWSPITFSDSLRTSESISHLASLKYLGFPSAHQVIGQEFNKVVFPMDSNFRYKNGKLQVRQTYYSLQGMLYQIITRVVNELKIIVIDNPELYSKLLEIKSMDLNS
jgi:hypothetical protein